MITESTPLAEVLDKAGAVEVLRSFGVTLGCNVDMDAPVGEAAKTQGVDAGALIKKLNNIKDEAVHADSVKVMLTEAAAKKMKDLNSMKAEGLRFSVMPGGCAGYTYGMEFGSRQDGDIETEDRGMKIFVDRRSAAKLTGATIDYIETLQVSGFKVSNPNAKATCGCGKSAAV